MLAFCMSDQWAQSWSADWADMLIKQVAGKTYRTIPNCNLMLKAILLNLEPYRLITVLRHCNTCHTKQTARICLCKSWHKKRLNMFRSLNTSPKPPSETQRITSEQYRKTAVCPIQICIIMRAVFKCHKGELPEGKKRRLPRANTSSDPHFFFRLRFPEQKNQ